MDETQQTPLGSGAKPAKNARAAAKMFWMTIGALFGVPILMFALYHRLRFVGLTNADAFDFAQLGRNISAGRGFVTYVLRPLALGQNNNPLHQPETTHGPLYPFLLALAFSAVGAKDNVASLVSGLFYILTVPVVYLLGKRMFTERVAQVSALVFALNALHLDFAASGLHITLNVFLSACLFLALYEVSATLRKNDSASVQKLLTLAGLLTGALYLSDSAFSFVIPVFAWIVFCALPVKRRLLAGWYGIPLCLLVMPWMLRNGLVTGNPVFGLRGAEVWMNTSIYPAATGYRLMSHDLTPDAELFQALLIKMFRGIYQILHALPQTSANWILAFFLPSLLFRFKDRAAENIRSAAMLFLAALSIEMMLFSVQMPLLLCLVPIVLVFAVAYLLHVMQQARLDKTSMIFAAGLIGLATVYPLLNDLALADKPTPLRLAPSARLLAHQSRPSDVAVSDQPWITAWYADRPSLWIPARDDRMGEARKMVTGTQWLFLTEQARAYSPSWEYVYDTLQTWRGHYEAVQRQGGPLPANIVIEETGQPLIDALSGFSSIAPNPLMAPNVVVAKVSALPERIASRDVTAGSGSASRMDRIK